MFHRFECSNSFSHKNSTYISAVARESYMPDGNPYEIRPISRSGIHIWPVLSMYGPNASGKTTFLESLSNLIINVWGNKRDLVGAAFVGNDNAKNNLITHELTFSILLNGTYCECKYGYKINVVEQYVAEEWLQVKEFLLSNSDFTDVFRRTGSDWGSIYVTPERVYPNADITEMLKAKTKKNKLFMSIFWDDDSASEPFSSIKNWFASVQTPESFFDEPSGMEVDKLVSELEESSEFKNKFLRYMQQVDSSILNVYVANREIKILRKINDVEENNETNDMVVSFEDESAGTRKMAVMYPRFSNALNNGGLLIVDELDTKLHRDALIAYIMLFHDEFNEKAQLIFSAHSLDVLRKAFVHKDEVYFVEKNKEGESFIGRLTLEGLSDEDKLKDYDELYKKGKLGATNPFMIFGM